MSKKLLVLLFCLLIDQALVEATTVRNDTQDSIEVLMSGQNNYTSLKPGQELSIPDAEDFSVKDKSSCPLYTFVDLTRDTAVYFKGYESTIVNGGRLITPMICIFPKTTDSNAPGITNEKRGNLSSKRKLSPRASLQERKNRRAAQVALRRGMRRAGRKTPVQSRMEPVIVPSERDSAKKPKRKWLVSKHYRRKSDELARKKVHEEQP